MTFDEGHRLLRRRPTDSWQLDRLEQCQTGRQGWPSWNLPDVKPDAGAAAVALRNATNCQEEPGCSAEWSVTLVLAQVTLLPKILCAGTNPDQGHKSLRQTWPVGSSSYTDDPSGLSGHSVPPATDCSFSFNLSWQCEWFYFGELFLLGWSIVFYSIYSFGTTLGVTSQRASSICQHINGMLRLKISTATIFNTI